MAAPSFVVASTGVTDAGGAWTNQSNVNDSSGLIIVLQVLQDGSTSGAVTISSWDQVKSLGGTTNAMDYLGAFPVGSPTAGYQHLWIGRSNGQAVVNGGNSTSEDLYLRWYYFNNGSAGTTLATVIENSTAGNATNGVGTSNTASDTAVVTLGPDRLALNFVAVNDDNAISEFTGETGGDWCLAVAPYAEASGTDGAIGLMQARVNPAVSQLNVTTLFPIYGATGTEEQGAQSFQFAEARTLTGLTLYYYKVSTPADNLVIEIQSDNAGVPSGTVLTTVATIAGASVPAGPIGVLYPCELSLSANTTYWIVVRRSGARDTVNYFVGRLGGTYDGGSAFKRDSGTWSDRGYDFTFTISTREDAAGTIDGGTGSIVDSDAWGVVGFALIGTTPSSIPHDLPLPQPSNFQNPAVFARACDWQRAGSIWLPTFRRPKIALA